MKHIEPFFHATYNVRMFIIVKTNKEEIKKKIY